MFDPRLSPTMSLASRSNISQAVISTYRPDILMKDGRDSTNFNELQALEPQRRERAVRER